MTVVTCWLSVCWVAAVLPYEHFQTGPIPNTLTHQHNFLFRRVDARLDALMCLVDNYAGVPVANNSVDADILIMLICGCVGVLEWW